MNADRRGCCRGVAGEVVPRHPNHFSVYLRSSAFICGYLPRVLLRLRSSPALVTADIAPGPLRPRHPTLVGSRAVRCRAGVDCRAPRQQGMGMGRTTIVSERPEPGIDRCGRGAHLIAVYSVRETRAGADPDQVEARAQKATEDAQIRGRGGAVPGHQAVVQSEGSEVLVVLGTVLIDPSALLAGRIVRDGGVRQPEAGCTSIGRVGDAAPEPRRVTRDRTVDEPDRCSPAAKHVVRSV